MGRVGLEWPLLLIILVFFAGDRLVDWAYSNPSREMVSRERKSLRGGGGGPLHAAGCAEPGKRWFGMCRFSSCGLLNAGKARLQEVMLNRQTVTHTEPHAIRTKHDKAVVVVSIYLSPSYTKKGTPQASYLHFFISHSPSHSPSNVKHHTFTSTPYSALGSATCPATNAISAAPTPDPSFAIPIRMCFSPCSPIWGTARIAARMCSSKSG
jgi:hypothetical protein